MMVVIHMHKLFVLLEFFILLFYSSKEQYPTIFIISLEQIL